MEKIDRIIKYLLVLLFIFTSIAKILYPYTFYSYIISVFKYLNINSIFSIIPSQVIATIFLAIVLAVEFAIIYTAFTDQRKFIFFTISFLTISLIVMAFSYYLGIDMDCGCFGNIITIENKFYNLIILSGLLLISFYLNKYGFNNKADIDLY